MKIYKAGREIHGPGWFACHRIRPRTGEGVENNFSIAAQDIAINLAFALHPCLGRSPYRTCMSDRLRHVAAVNSYFYLGVRVTSTAAHDRGSNSVATAALPTWKNFC